MKLRSLSARERFMALALLGVLGLALACFTGSAAATQQPGAGGDAGTVKVLYAGSLAHVMENGIGPAFQRATGGNFEGYAGGSTRLANEIKGKVRRGDVYISAHPHVNARLMGNANGNWVAWYAAFMRSPLAIGYNPESKFAAALESEPWYQVVTEPGFRLGRTDPRLDPKGKLAVEAVRQVAVDQCQPALQGRILAHSEIFPEETLVGRLQAGQLDAGFFYQGEAIAVGIPTISIKPIELGAVYTISVLERAPNRAGAIAFVAFLLGPKGRQILEDNGFDLIKPIKVTGDGSAVPDRLRARLGTD